MPLAYVSLNWLPRLTWNGLACLTLNGLARLTLHGLARLTLNGLARHPPRLPGQMRQLNFVDVDSLLLQQAGRIGALRIGLLLLA